MSKARKIFMIIAAILSIGLALLLGICAIAFFVSMNNEELLQKMLDGLNRTSKSVDEDKAFILRFGIIFLILAILELANIVLSFIGFKTKRTGVMALNIVFGVASGVYVNSVGGIIGLLE